jgi:hypothetical protein
VKLTAGGAAAATAISRHPNATVINGRAKAFSAAPR